MKKPKRLSPSTIVHSIPYDRQERMAPVIVPDGLFNATVDEIHDLALEHYRRELMRTEVRNYRIGRVLLTEEGLKAFDELPDNPLRMCSVKALRRMLEVAVPFELHESPDAVPLTEEDKEVDRLYKDRIQGREIRHPGLGQIALGPVHPKMLGGARRVLMHAAVHLRIDKDLFAVQLILRKTGDETWTFVNFHGYQGPASS